VPVAHQPKVGNLRNGDFPAQFAVRLMHKDFGLIDDLARSCGAVMPVTTTAAQINAAELNRGREEDFLGRRRSDCRAQSPSVDTRPANW
jgi:3-hydroxyisobutyrate dehydrogenase-like beta-hydroxyacid dehydrogenase